MFAERALDSLYKVGDDRRRQDNVGSTNDEDG
jgi:hypothetical protein